MASWPARAVLQEVLRQVLGRDVRAADHHDQALNHVLQFSHISGPRIFFENFQDVGLHGLERLF